MSDSDDSETDFDRVFGEGAENDDDELAENDDDDEFDLHDDGRTSMDATRSLMSPATASAARLFDLAMASFDDAVRSTPDSTVIINHYGGVLATMARRTNGDTSLNYFQRAFEQYQKASNLSGILRLAAAAARGDGIRRYIFIFALLLFRLLINKIQM